MSERLQTELGSFSLTQANRFAATQTVVLQYNDDAVGANGGGTSLSLTVFKDNAGSLTLAIRGTLEPIGDIFPTDTNIGLRGAGYDQIAALYNWWQRVSHASGQAVAQYRVTEYALSEAPASALLLYTTLNGTSVRAVVLERIADANATGALIPALGADGDGKLDVTGHSLGGHLTMAFAALFPEATASATTFNAPGYSTTSINQQFFATLGAAVPTQASIGSVTTNVVANHTSASDVRWQGIAMLNSRPGTAMDVPIEAQTPPSAEPVKPAALNHSQMVLADALAVYALFDKAQTGLSTTAFNSLLKGAANQEHAGLEGLVGAMRAFMGLGSAALPAGNNQREALYQAISSISDSASFQPLAGQLLVRQSSSDLRAAARNDFSAVVALQDLSPFWATGKDAAADGKLTTLWQSTRVTDYIGWLADKGSAVATTYTDAWIADRSSLLQSLVTANTKDAATNPDGYLAVQGTASGSINTRFIDLASGAMVQVNHAQISPSTAPNRYVIFGDGGANTLNGSAQEDHLYGGAGNDTLNGMSGNDYLEGGAGTDTYQFTGNFGHDVIIDAGGAGIIRINADVLDGGIKVTDTIWESVDGQYIHVLVGADLIIGQRTSAWAATVTDTITIRNWQAGVGEMGITPQTAASAAPAPQSHLTVYQDYSPATNNQGVFTNIVDGQSTTSPNSGDYNVQRTTTTGQASIVTTGTAAQLIEADSWDQQITTGVGNDLVIAGQWALPAGSHDADIVNTGEGSDMVFTGQGRDIINTGAGDDFIMSGGLASVASMQSEDLASRSPAGVARVHAHARPSQRGSVCHPSGIRTIANSDHLTLGCATCFEKKTKKTLTRPRPPSPTPAAGCRGVGGAVGRSTAWLA